MNFKLDVNYLDSLIKTSQSAEKVEDPIKKTIQLGLQASCSIYVRSGKKNRSGSGFHIGNNIVITAGHVVPIDQTLTEILVSFDNKNFLPATFLISDPNIDSGAVKVERLPSNIPALQFANSDVLVLHCLCSQKLPESQTNYYRLKFLQSHNWFFLLL